MRNTDGTFAPGNPGRPKGSGKNVLRDVVRDFLINRWDELPDLFNQLTAKEKISVMVDLMPYAVPRLQAVAYAENKQAENLALDATEIPDEKLHKILDLLADA